MEGRERNDLGLSEVSVVEEGFEGGKVALGSQVERGYMQPCCWEGSASGSFLDAMRAQNTQFLLSLCVYLEERLMELEGAVVLLLVGQEPSCRAAEKSPNAPSGQIAAGRREETIRGFARELGNV